MQREGRKELKMVRNGTNDSSSEPLKPSCVSNIYHKYHNNNNNNMEPLRIQKTENIRMHVAEAAFKGKRN